MLEDAIREVERSFERSTTERNAGPIAPSLALDVVSDPLPVNPPTPPPIPTVSPALTPQPAAKIAETPRRPVAPPRSPGQPKRATPFHSLIRLTGILVIIAGAGAAAAYWPQLRTKSVALWQSAALTRARVEKPRASTARHTDLIEQ